MNKLIKFLIVISIGMFVVNCSVTTGLNISDKLGSGKKVQASISNANFLGFTPASNTQSLLKDLAEQCPSGDVTGITVHVSHRPFIFILFEEFKATGYCMN